jgi:hypothetical protein
MQINQNQFVTPHQQSCGPGEELTIDNQFSPKVATSVQLRFGVLTFGVAQGFTPMSLCARNSAN